MARSTVTQVGRVMSSILALAALAIGTIYAFAAVGACALVTWVCGAQASACRRARRSRRARYVRAEQRECRLEQAGVPRTEIDELTALVALACRSTTNEADHRELDDLLDAYAEA